MTCCSPRSCRAVAVLMVVGVGPLATARADAAEARTAGAIEQVLFVPGGIVSPASTGTVCVHVSAGATSDPGTMPACSIPAPVAAGGRGRSTPKFTLGPGGELLPKEDAFSNETTIAAGNTVARASADWSSFHDLAGADALFGALQEASAQVVTGNPTAANHGRAVGDGRDPLRFSVNRAGTLEYTVTLTNLQLEADHPGARNQLSVRVQIQNVRSGGAPLSGPLWSLDIRSAGTVASKNDLTVDLALPSQLGISAADEAAAEAFLRDQFQPLPDGSIGSQNDVPLFGNGGPLPALLLDYTPGSTILYFDDLIADAELPQLARPVPAMSPWAAVLLALALGLAAAARSPGRGRWRSSSGG
jgi:hypothetical protein